MKYLIILSILFILISTSIEVSPIGRRFGDQGRNLASAKIHRNMGNEKEKVICLF